MDIVFQDGRKVDAVFLGIDVITYSGGVEETKYPIPEYLYDDYVWNDIPYLLNKDVVLQYIMRPLADPDKTDLATMYASWWTEEYYNKQWVMHNYVPAEPAQEEADPENLSTISGRIWMRIYVLILKRTRIRNFMCFIRPTAFCIGMTCCRKNSWKRC